VWYACSTLSAAKQRTPSYHHSQCTLCCLGAWLLTIETLRYVCRGLRGFASAVQTAVNGNPTAPAESWYNLAAVKSFGPWGPTGGCNSNCSWSSDGSQFTCKPTGRWPQGMCSLKKLANPAKPEYWSSNASERSWCSVVICDSSGGP
jgi:hypothetical protein